MDGQGSDFRRELGQQLRVDSVRASAAAGSGHPTSSMSAADLMAVLLDGHLRLDYQNPANPNNDHLVFSKGHASPLYYSILKAADIDEVGWPEPAAAEVRTESTRSCWPSSRRKSLPWPAITRPPAGRAWSRCRRTGP